MPQLAIEGRVEPPNDEADKLRREVGRLRHELETANEFGKNAMHKVNESVDALIELRQQLAPLYRALQKVFGEIELIDLGSGVNPQAATPVADARVTAVWESWKSRLTAGAGKVIDALLLHQEMNSQQLAIATGLHKNTIPNVIFQLNKAGLINKNGGRFSLKKL